MQIVTYTQLRFSRSDSRSWSTGVAGSGEATLAEAREMAKNLAASPATDFIEVITEDRDGAITSNTKVYVWNRASGWTQK